MHKFVYWNVLLITHIASTYDMSFVWPLCSKIVVPQNEIRLNHKMIVAFQSSTTVVCFCILKMHSTQTPNEGREKTRRSFLDIDGEPQSWFSHVGCQSFSSELYIFQTRTSFFHRNRLLVCLILGWYFFFFFISCFYYIYSLFGMRSQSWWWVSMTMICGD